MNDRFKAAIILLIICILATVLPSSLLPKNEWADLLGLLGSLGCVISFIIVAVVILKEYSNDDEENEEV